MKTIKESFTSLKSSDRIQSLDIMRGFVLLGILLMNINGMGLLGLMETLPFLVVPLSGT
jgi:uncharacterized protein